MNKYYYSFLAMITIPLAGMSTDIYIPSLPAIVIHFETIKALSQYTVTAYVFAMSIAQLFAGPVSDALGRKKLLLAALLLQVLAIFAILFSPNIYSMIVARFFQGLGAAFMIVPARAILNDIFKGKQLKKHFNYLTIAFAVGPIIAPFIGGYLQQYFGWKMSFYCILGYALLLFFLYVFSYQETHHNRHEFSISRFGKNYKTIFSNIYFLAGSVLAGLLIAYSGLFNVVGTFIVQKALHKSAITYGHVALLMGLAWLLGNIVNRLTFEINRTLKTQLALYITLAATIMSVILGFKGYFSLATVVAPTFIMVMMAGTIFANYVSECLTLFPKTAASANAALFAVTWVVYAFFTYIATLIKIHSLIPLATTYFITAIVSLLLFYSVLYKHEKALFTNNQ